MRGWKSASSAERTPMRGIGVLRAVAKGRLRPPSPTRGGEGREVTTRSIRPELRRGVREAVALELLAQRCLQDLAGRSMRNTVNECDVVGHPPFGDLAVHEFQDLLARGLLPVLELYDQKRPLVPFGMMHADHGGFPRRRGADPGGFPDAQGNT